MAVGEGGSLRAGDVLGKERVVRAFRAEQRQRAAIAGGSGQAGVNERLPVVGVDQDVWDLAASADALTTWQLGILIWELGF